VTKPAAATRSIVIEREMPHPPERVWRALTQGALIQEWLMENDFQPFVGHRFNFHATPMPHWNGIVDCQVLVVEPNQRLSYSLERLRRRGGGRTKDRRHVDIDADQGRRSRAHGAVGLPTRRRSQLSGRKLWLAAVHRRPGTGGCRARLRMKQITRYHPLLVTLHRRRELEGAGADPGDGRTVGRPLQTQPISRKAG
jgi:Activator of Hsp90 ATPase homolog 1-like protein